ncbi:helix-turn-helix domain-containing protein [uncultured Microscilla sp.]|uniref:helix-turn-helix domain-containing protein n=1 Tax=uncultured Microscilla sp. TaxID=432653 RepID=UPI00262B20D3|nr:helix-turn-helix domain-containing protein [uncultured Microscilla sp.]
MAVNIPTTEDLQDLMKDFEKTMYGKIEALFKAENSGLDIYTNKRIKEEMGGDISDDTLARMRERGELPAKKVSGKWYYKGADVRRVFTE